MEPGLLRDVLTLAGGVATGVLSAAFGLGGAIISTPMIRALGASASVAVGTTLPSILPSAITGTVRYMRTGLIDWRAVAVTAPVGIAAAVGGSVLSRVIPGEGHALMLLTAVLLAFTAWRMWRTIPSRQVAEADADAGIGAAETELALAEPETERPQHASAPLLAGIGAGAGLLSGLLGVGGGIVMVPAFTELACIPVKRAIATSLSCVALFAVPGTITHTLLGGIDWRYATLLAIGVVPGAYLGSGFVLRSTDRRLRVRVALFLGLIAALYAGGELAALTR